VRLLDERGIAIEDIGLRRPTLDEVFLALTGQHLVPPDHESATQQAADAA
jgi:ABC-2 type transport system ATP-binding protein